MSTHGYFEIQRADTYTSYLSGIDPVFDKDHNRMGPVEVVARGSVEELGLRYDPAIDDLVEEDDDTEVIKAAVLRFLNRLGP